MLPGMIGLHLLSTNMPRQSLVFGMAGCEIPRNSSETWRTIQLDADLGEHLQETVALD